MDFSLSAPLASKVMRKVVFVFMIIVFFSLVPVKVAMYVRNWKKMVQNVKLRYNMSQSKTDEQTNNIQPK